MRDVMVFRSVGAALRAGFQICGRTENGYRARLKTASGWVLAEIVVREDAPDGDACDREWAA